MRSKTFVFEKNRRNDRSRGRCALNRVPKTREHQFGLPSQSPDTERRRSDRIDDTSRVGKASLERSESVMRLFLGRYEEAEVVEMSDMLQLVVTKF